MAKRFLSFKLSGFLALLTTALIWWGCKGRSSQTIEVTPQAPKAPAPEEKKAEDVWGQFNNKPQEKPQDNLPSSIPDPIPQTNPPAAGGSPAPSSPPLPTPSPATPPPSCDRSNTSHFGKGYGTAFEQNGIWVAYQDPGLTQLCTLAIPRCSSDGGQGYGQKWCEGPLLLAKDVKPTADNAHTESICVVTYGPTCTAP